jgi:ADP-heptose:LPS heptosyltransferase
MKILVIRLSSIGDIVLTSPVVRCIKQQVPSCEIHFLTKAAFASIIHSNPFIDEVHTLNESTKNLIQALRLENFDVVIDLHKNIRTSRIKKALGVKSYSFPKLNIEKWLLVNFKRQSMPDVHVVDRYFEAVKSLNVTNEHKGIDFFIPEEDEIDVVASYGLTKYVAVAIGAQFATKRLPEEKLIEVLTQLTQPIVLLGGKEDNAVGERLKSTLKGQPIFNLCGELSLAQSASMVKQSAAVLTHDTGLMHIASAFDVPIISVWGNTVPELGMYAYRPSQNDNIHIHQVENLSCRPCSKIGHQKCPKGHFKCMVEQDSKEIAASVRQYLD